MAQRMQSRPGLFGGMRHEYERGRRVGESLPGLFGDTDSWFDDKD